MENVIGIILAAGYSSRMGEFKMTQFLSGLPVIEHPIQNMYDTCNKILIVTGFQFEKLRYLEKKYQKVSLVFNPNYSEGMFSSVLAGLAYSEAKRYVVMPGDCPAVHSKTFRDLTAFSGDICLPSYLGKTGHPVMISNFARKELLRGSFLTLEHFIKSHPYKEIPVKDAGILMDLDSPEDFRKLETFLRVRNHDDSDNRRYQQRKNNSINQSL
ncbi:nucleotidyltransferase family protein [Caproiciproducens faecalis]|uniref:Nucleotidyltransferase family protein n=1 Tax=Caproiciproducens faecalis TaxID=2820301 RepID=A0ABS7DJP5_9FIRM|nr:nucleotidyltransferase family protein [Caproiciproducens faecalis]MBW7571510.1 nucleotidyltransferase family protein [Caproiciproducens faecalis]